MTSSTLVSLTLQVLARFLWRPAIVGSVFCLAVGSVSPMVALSADASASPPFTVLWTHGTCNNCRTATGFVDVEFIGTNEAWAIGYVPPGEVGTGDYSVLHTHDGGKTWIEVPRSYQHNDPPRVSFASQREGWIMVVDITAADRRLLQTKDGGRHWSRLSLRDLSVHDIQYIGGGVGYAESFDTYAKQGYLYQTKDFGRTWTKVALPAGFSADRMFFAKDNQGLLAGCLDHKVVVIHTIDSGRHWEIAKIQLPPIEPSKSGYCDVFADDISFPETKHGWILTTRRGFPPADDHGFAVVSRTLDGGTTWTTAFQDAYPESRKNFTGVQFLNDQIGIISKQDDWAAGERKPSLLYTTDGGQKWLSADLPRAIQGCRRHSRALMCASEDFWLATINWAGDNNP